MSLINWILVGIVLGLLIGALIKVLSNKKEK
ncbi:hypothetical protein SRDD_10440 [Serratia sp. DD3]|nr:hypothetical protein SRDD_10440 [Serratia sp. DD3]